MKAPMKFRSQSRDLSRLLIALAVLYFAFLPKAQALSPPPDGGYPGGNTAEGQNALFNLTTGPYNTAVGLFSLMTITDAGYNTAIGAGTLLFNTAGENTATGAGALFSNTTGIDNTANGAFALFSNTIGERNNAVGDGALFANNANFNNAFGAFALEANTTGGANDAFGDEALQENTTGTNNTAIGYQALRSNGTGNGNVAVGARALFSGTGVMTGSDNTAIGNSAGENVDTGSGNVYIGASVEAVDPAENDHTYIRNINTTSVSGGNADFVTVDLTTGLLGHLSSSQRYKEDIHPMDNASQTLYRLKPVTYCYKKEIDRSQSLDYGLIAEDVAEIDSNLAVRARDGQIESVRYNAINAMLLNEFLKEHRKVQELDATVAQQQKDFQATIAQLAARLEEQASQILKVSAQLELSKPVSRTASVEGR
jgi:trimeric autotransporter adhesin